MKKINVAKLLRNCPKGMELGCTMWDNVTFEGIEDVGYINILIKIPEGIVKLSNEGCFTHNCNSAKCVIYPKGKTTWEGFVPPCKFKDGDIVYFITENDNEYITIFKNAGNVYLETYIDVAIATSRYSLDVSFYIDNIKEQRLATAEEKQKLFDIIKANGYRWDAETKTLEKLVAIFKVGDKIKLKNAYAKKYNDFNTREITEIQHSHYILDDKQAMPLSNQYLYKLVPDKFDITTLKPFESRVLVRTNHFHDNWVAGFFSHKDSDGFAPFWTTADKNYQQCIPYEGNEHLLGTTNDCDEFYKTTWK